MFTLEFLPEDQRYQLKSDDHRIYPVKYIGNLQIITTIAIQECGIEEEELAFAYEIMAKRKHLKGHFGIRGKFLFSE
jgi:hypothetical protein